MLKFILFNKSFCHYSYSDEAPDTADDSDEDLITSYIPGNTKGHPIIRIGSPTTGDVQGNRPILGKNCSFTFYMIIDSTKFG